MEEAQVISLLFSHRCSSADAQLRCPPLAPYPPQCFLSIGSQYQLYRQDLDLPHYAYQPGQVHCTELHMGSRHKASKELHESGLGLGVHLNHFDNPYCYNLFTFFEVSICQCACSITYTPMS